MPVKTGSKRTQQARVACMGAVALGLELLRVVIELIAHIPPQSAVKPHGEPRQRRFERQRERLRRQEYRPRGTPFRADVSGRPPVPEILDPAVTQEEIRA